MDYTNLDRLVDSYRDELIENIRKWIAIPSVQGEPAGENAPFGREVRRMPYGIPGVICRSEYRN